MNRRLAGVVAAVALLAVGCGPGYPLTNTPTASGVRSVVTVPSPPPAAALCVIVAGKADRHCTPGALNPLVTQATIADTICTKGWSTQVRPPVWFTNRIKTERMRAYGVTASPSTVELDHLVPIELGGWPGDRDNPNDPRNDEQLWPEQWDGTDGAHAKDQEENVLHRAVCNGRMTLDAARHKIVADWVR